MSVSFIGGRKVAHASCSTALDLKKLNFHSHSDFLLSSIHNSALLSLLNQTQDVPVSFLSTNNNDASPARKHLLINSLSANSESTKYAINFLKQLPRTPSAITNPLQLVAVGGYKTCEVMSL